MLLLTLVSVLSLRQQYELSNLRYASPLRWQAAMSALDGVPDRKFYGNVIWPISADQVIAVADGLRDRRWSVFAWKQAGWLGRDLDTFGPAVGGCEGELERVAAVSGGDGVEVEGWALDKHLEPGWGWVLITGASSRVLGLAHVGVPRDDLLGRHPGEPLRFAGWRGYVAGTPSPAALRAWLVLPSRRICRLPPALPPRALRAID